jgi:phosphoribosyl-dephospho-CoA transferase
MGLKPHDLLRITDPIMLCEFCSLPEWARDSLQAYPYVVVRRAIAPKGSVAVGIRGKERNQRIAAQLPLSAAGECISPETLSQCKYWHNASDTLTLPYRETLQGVAEAAEQESLIWGPIGSVGFHLATGANSLRRESDLDILVRFSSQIHISSLRRFRNALLNSQVRMDIVLEADERSAALDEYLESPYRVLIKTPVGPILGPFAGHPE